MPVVHLKTGSKVTDTEIQDVLGPRIQFLTALSDNDNDYCVISAPFPPAWWCRFTVMLNERSFTCLEERSRGFGRITGSRSALVMYLMYLAVLSTVGEMYPARPCHSWWWSLAILPAPPRQFRPAR